MFGLGKCKESVCGVDGRSSASSEQKGSQNRAPAMPVKPNRLRSLCGVR